MSADALRAVPSGLYDDLVLADFLHVREVRFRGTRLDCAPIIKSSFQRPAGD